MAVRVSPETRFAKGRNPRGYGLASLVVVLFFVAILVQTIVDGFARETTEARAEAAFNAAKEDLDTFKITGAMPNATDMPHIGAKRLVKVTRVSAGLQIAFTALDDRAAALFEQKLRAYLNIEKNDAIGTISAGAIRREYPERVLRRGDRMATNLQTRNIARVSTVVSGTGTSQTVTATRFTGIPSTLIETSRFSARNLDATKLTATGRLEADTLTLDQSLVSNALTANGARVTSYMQSDRGTVTTGTLSGQLATSDRLAGVDVLSFQTLKADGLRVRTIHSDTARVGQVLGDAIRTGKPPGWGWATDK
ncbi:hypothetical protein LAZ40_03375 [Cereibacter sphaeroides]|uniref:hypothetical protein n=1 Tax=Cereibacter sphaeroides TaxID=1063 RepID=UPI001F22AE70|nr:hypothetical protein [Cereibacter sphaeroides]MCE6958097.1 hypothetical protein [Cereibacter sphaeroides]MCE6971416.1 hypothetical protein [Cereibacter sphaeroides]